jgi:serine/threonine protein phosphatase PrpC
MVCFDIKVDTDDFIILSTDGIFESMDIFQVVSMLLFRLTS